MKRILLIGDSIRKGYDRYVEMALEDVAQVVYPKENCRFSSYIVRHLLDWKKELGLDRVDLVHWNVGLWDDLVIPDGLPLVGLEEYKRNIERICNLIELLFPDAKMIFATSTPVQEEFFTEYKRYNKDTEAYNAAAVEIVRRHGGEINDLYTTALALPASCHSDQTHYYTKRGTQVLTDQVLRHIEKALNIKGKRLDYDLLFPEKTAVVGI